MLLDVGGGGGEGVRGVRVSAFVVMIKIIGYVHTGVD